MKQIPRLSLQYLKNEEIHALMSHNFQNISFITFTIYTFAEVYGFFGVFVLNWRFQKLFLVKVKVSLDYPRNSVF